MWVQDAAVRPQLGCCVCARVQHPGVGGFSTLVWVQHPCMEGVQNPEMSAASGWVKNLGVGAGS